MVIKCVSLAARKSGLLQSLFSLHLIFELIYVNLSKGIPKQGMLPRDALLKGVLRHLKHVHLQN